MELIEKMKGVVFCLERMVNFRVIEVKLKVKLVLLEVVLLEKGLKGDFDFLIGNYIVEVIFDGEVRVKIMIKMEMKNFFWREDVEFFDLLYVLLELLVVFKWLEGSFDSIYFYI